MASLKKINKTYHIIVYSQLTTNVSNQSSNCTALFDFNLLPKSRWKVKYYGAFGTANYTSNQTPQIFCDFGQNNNEFGKNTSSLFPTTIKQPKFYCGNMISYTNYGNACSFNVPATDNGYFYLDNTPTNNFINIFVYNLIQAASWSPNMNNALFNFAFEQLDDPIYRTIRNVYNVVFNSEYGQNNSTTDNSLGTKKYYFDWTRLPEGEYEVTTSMTTSDDYGSTNYSSFSIFSDFGQNSTVFIPSNTSNVKVVNNNFLALVVCEQSGNVGPLVTYSNYTPPVFLNTRPYNSDVDIFIISTYSAQYYYARALGVNMNYTLSFNFKWLGNNY